jgi:beta-galactosidase
MKNNFITLKQTGLALCLFILLSIPAISQTVTGNAGREHTNIDNDWRFALGHPFDIKKDFYNGSSSFSYLAKAGYGDGAAAAGFDDRAWRKVNLPHDWAVELPFDSKGSLSHGFKAIGRNFPETSVGWYRKLFKIPASDLGRHISIAFDGVFRNSIVWVNGHYLGTEASGYNSFEYNISEYLNYGGDNEIAVRADATMEEGWFYEGAGIYRHVWLNKTNELHVVPNGTFVTTQVKDNEATVNTTATITNNYKNERVFNIEETILDAAGKVVTFGEIKNVTLPSFTTGDFISKLAVTNPKLWSLETPYLHKLVTVIKENGTEVDRYETVFGIRTIRFDANEGFFLNGKHVEIKGTNNHQDHAGVGVAIPDALQDFRISTLKSLGCNAYRCSHNPPTPELLNACDRLGMLVIDENRLMGVTDLHFNELKRMMLRDRNHPSIIAWSIGNEEWHIEGNITGARITETMQNYAKTIDSTRYFTAAISGGIGAGISTEIQLLGYNYIANKNTDEQHKKYPLQFSWGTEEGSTVVSRGIYVDDMAKHQLVAYDRKQNDYFLSLEDGWKHYASRPYLAGMFIWTGFDYRGEPTPFGWPSIESYFGMVDACGFAKDDAWYLRSWWTDKPVLHILPHWNWKGREGQDIAVWAYSNCDEVELFLNKKSQGKQHIPVNGHLEWKVKYAPGVLEAIGYNKNGQKIMTDVVKTTGDASVITLRANKITIAADKNDLTLVTVQVNDKNNLMVPTAGNDINFSISGPGKIIGVGNGDQTSLEPDQYIEKISTVNIDNIREKLNASTETGADYDDSKWQNAFKDERNDKFGKEVKSVVYRGSFNLPDDVKNSTITFFYNSLGKKQSIFVNGKEVGHDLPENLKGDTFVLDKVILKAGRNTIAIVAEPLLKKNMWSSVNTNPGLIQLVTPPDEWKRKTFSGLAQVIVQSTGGTGEIQLKANSPGLKPAEIKIRATDK